jgi:hypothetical protein
MVATRFFGTRFTRFTWFFTNWVLLLLLNPVSKIITQFYCLPSCFDGNRVFT